MQVYYDNILINHQFLTKSTTQMQPKLIYNTKPNKLYTLMMYDPNVVAGNYLHWLIINISGNKIDSGTILLPYKGPNPPVNSGIHHYIFILLEQSVEIISNKWEENERIMQMNKLYDKLNLKKLREIGTTYFQIKSQVGGKRIRKKTRRTRRTITKKRTMCVYK